MVGSIVSRKISIGTALCSSSMSLVVSLIRTLHVLIRYPEAMRYHSISPEPCVYILYLEHRKRNHHFVQIFCVYSSISFFYAIDCSLYSPALCLNHLQHLYKHLLQVYVVYLVCRNFYLFLCCW